MITEDSTISLGLVYDGEINASFEEDESDDVSKVSSPRWTLGAFSDAEFFALRNNCLNCLDVVNLKPLASNVTMVFAFWRVWFEEIRLLRFFGIVLGNWVNSYGFIETRSGLCAAVQKYFRAPFLPHVRLQVISFL